MQQHKALYFDTASTPEHKWNTAPPHFKQDTPDDQESLEYHTVITCTPQLTNALAMDPVTISGHLLAKGLIPHNLHSRLVHSTDPREKAQQLLLALTACVRTNASSFDAFISVLKSQGEWCESITSLLITTYNKKRFC